MKVNVYTTEGKVARTIDAPEVIFGAEWNADLVSQVLYSQASNRRAGTAHTKDRSEVSGGGKKPWAQKGSGRARHGSSRSPIWRHGGVTHGPRNEKDFKKDVPKAMMRRALMQILSAKLKTGKLIFVDTVSIDGKTKAADTYMKGLANIEGFKTLCTKKANNVYMTTPKAEEVTKRSFRNLAYVTLHNMEDLNPLDLANTRYLIISDPEKTFEYLAAKLNK